MIKAYKLSIIMLLWCRIIDRDLCRPLNIGGTDKRLLAGTRHFSKHQTL